jgi:hypothetical protein
MSLAGSFFSLHIWPHCGSKNTTPQFKHALNPFHEIGGTCAASLCFASAEARMCQAASDLKND